MITLLVVTDGRRDCIAETIPSALANLQGPITHRVIHDDSGDPDYRAWLAHTFPSFILVASPARQGFSGAYANAWRYLSATPREWVLSTEDDFTFCRPVDLVAMAEVLTANPHLAQMALRRQPWNPTEVAAGGVVEQHPDAYADVSDGRYRWLEHRLFWTTNPSLHRTELCRGGWPRAQRSEGVFTAQLLEDPDLRFGYWGERSDGPWVTHIGHSRAGDGY